MLEDSKTNLRPVDSMGEFALIEHLTQHFRLEQKSSIYGIGDDAAVLSFGKEQVVVSTDMLVEGVHFNLGYMPLKHLGYKAVAVNVSDICAMNAIPQQITCSLAVSNRFSVEALEEFYDGIALACAAYNIDLVGGDTSATSKGMTLSITAIGSANPTKITYRSGAKAGNLLVVSGDLGGAYLGFQVLERERQVFEANPAHQPDLDSYTYLVERQLKPEARLDVVKLLNQLGVQPTSMIDISDGLSSEIKHLCKSSKVGCQLYEEKIPIDPVAIRTCEEFSLDPTLVALSGGEDYELLFTIDASHYDQIKGNPNLTVIGHLTHESQGANLITRSGESIELKAQGWTSF